MMSKCRICLETKRNLCSIFETDQGLPYASIITLITGIRIAKDMNDLICQLCRRKLRDFYEFKLLIERSDLELSKDSKVFKFNTIDDIKAEFVSQLNHMELSDVASNYNSLLMQVCRYQNENDCIYYNNTLIRKLIKSERETVPIEEFLNTIKTEDFEEEENNHVDDYVEDASVDEEYNCKRKKKTSKVSKKEKSSRMVSKKGKSSNRTRGSLKDVNDLRIKPILLKDLRLVKTYIRKKKKPMNKEKLCPFCGKICKSLKTHILTHNTVEKSFKCNKCSKSYRTKASLNSHIKSHSAIKNLYKCDHCIGTFSSKGAIRSHMAAHTEKHSYPCIICNKEFKWKSGLRRHMEVHKMGAKPIQCDACHMSFYTNYHLKTHYRVHTKERPFRCELCSQPYSYKRDFNRHCLKKHGVVVDRRPVHVMNHEVLRTERALMKDLVLRLHGIPTDSEPMDSFSGPQKALAFQKFVKVMQNNQIEIDVHL